MCSIILYELGAGLKKWQKLSVFDTCVLEITGSSARVYKARQDES
jgi:hypothetical protein